MTTSKILASISAILCCLHCGGSSDGASKGQSPAGIQGTHGSCAGASDCAAKEVCVATPSSGGACAPTCSVSGNDCSGQASCGQLGTVSVNVCKAESSTSGTGGGSNEQASQEQTYIPCKSDAECQALEQGAVCAQDQHGDKQCTVLCAKEEDCNVPSIAGIGVDFFTCTEDKSNTTRTVCLLDPKCENDPLSCTSGFGTGTTPPGGDPGGTLGGDNPGGTLGGGTLGGDPQVP